MNISRAATVLVVSLLVVLAGCASDPGAVQQPGGESTITPSTTSGESSTTRTPATTTATLSANGTLEVHFINVGQGASTLLITPENETVLIDSGDWQDDGEYVLQYLEQRNITRIDHLITSHADADHIGGHAAVIEYFETEADGVGAVYDPGIASTSQTYERYLDAIEAHDVTLYRTQDGDTIPIEDVSARVLAPPSTPLEGSDRNENSIVLAVEHGSHQFLFPGDAESDEEAYLIQNHGTALESTVLQAGHHGSRSSSGTALLDAVQPRVAVISSPYDSRYGHPHNETLQRLATSSVKTYWTATHGHVMLQSGGRNLTIATQREATTKPMELRSASPISPETTDSVTVREVIVASGAGGTAGTQTETPEPVTVTSPTAATSTATASEGTVTLANVHADAAGAESENLNDEYVVFENSGDESLDMTGWQLSDAAGHVYTFPDGFTLAAGATVTVRTGSGSDTDTNLYWGSERPIWNNGGDTVTVTDDEGTVVIEETYA
jgi:competence protein ComEC